MSHSNVQVKGGYEYFVILTNDYSCYSHMYLIRSKFDTFDIFKEFRALVEKKLGRIIKILWSDCGEEYSLGELEYYLKDEDIISLLTAPNTPRQNAVLEMRNRILMDIVRLMMSYSSLLNSF